MSNPASEFWQRQSGLVVDGDEHDPDCTDCEHGCPWRSNPLGAPYCQICDDHYENAEELSE